MLLKLKDKTTVRSLRNHSVEILRELNRVLAEGAPACQDPHRDNFYELEGSSRIFYIFISPATGKVTLLAVWETEKSDHRASAGKLVMATCCASHG
jgi:hypothetical protein